METAIMKQKEVPEMDDVEEIISKISEDSPYKRRPTQKRTWMTVPEMGKLLGFGTLLSLDPVLCLFLLKLCLFQCSFCFFNPFDIVCLLPACILPLQYCFHPEDISPPDLLSVFPLRLFCSCNFSFLFSFFLRS